MRVLAGPVGLDGDLATPAAAQGVVLFAHGSGNGRHSPRKRQVASALGRAGFATLLLDLLTLEEEASVVLCSLGNTTGDVLDLLEV